MAEAALKLVESMEVDRKALTYVETIKGLPPIRTNEEYLYVGKLWQDGKALLKEIDIGYDDLIKAAHKLHKDAVAKKAMYYAPADAGVRAAKNLMIAWDAAQEAIRKAEESRLREIARKAEEERLLMEAIQAEAAGEPEEATAIMEAPAYVPPIILPKETPKMAGGPVFRTITKFRVVNEAIVPRQYLSVDLVKIGGVVRALKQAANIPGIEVYEERC